MTSTQVLTHALSDSDMNQMMLDSFQADIWKNKVGGGGGGGDSEGFDQVPGCILNTMRG